MTQKSNHKEYRLFSLSGIKDLNIFKASVSAREQRDFSKDGQAVAAAQEESFADVKARAERYGVDLDRSTEVGLGLS